MKYPKKIAIIIVWLFSQSFLYGQENKDHYIQPVVDSVLFAKKPYSTASEIIGIVVPSAMIMYGFISLGDNSIRVLDFTVRNSIEQNNAFWNTHIDDFVQFTPAIAAYTLKLCKMESKYNLADMTIIYGLSNLLAGNIISRIKVITGRERPDHSNNRSFPSGHTETAFVAAEFLYQEFRDHSVWISVGGYCAATFTGIARVYNNKHWVSDVVASAGIGILSTKAVYWTYPYIQKLFKKKDQPIHAFIFPTYNNGNMSLNFSHTF